MAFQVPALSGLKSMSNFPSDVVRSDSLSMPPAGEVRVSSTTTPETGAPPSVMTVPLKVIFSPRVMEADETVRVMVVASPEPV